MSEYGDSEVDGVMTGRPPSSYGSMHSDDDEDEDDFEPPVKHAETKVRLYRSGSPETAITERTHTNQSSVYQDGPFLRQQSIVHKEHSHSRHEEPMTLEQSEVQSEWTDRALNEEPDDREMRETNLPEQPNESAAMEVQEQQSKEPVYDFDEIVVHYEEPKEPPPPPPEGAGLQFRHTHSSLTLRHVLTAMVNSLSQIHPSEMSFYKRCLSSNYKFKKNYPVIADLTDPLDVADKMIEICKLGEALHLTVRNLQNIGRNELSKTLRKTCRRDTADLTHHLIDAQGTVAPKKKTVIDIQTLEL